MSGLLLDTSGYIHLQRGHPDAAAAVRKAERVVLSPVVVGELLDAFRKSGSRRRNERFLSDFMAQPRVELASIEASTAEYYAAIKAALRAAGTPVPLADVWISATAMEHGLKVLTSDADFQRIPQILVEPIEAGPLLKPRRARNRSIRTSGRAP